MSACGDPTNDMELTGWVIELEVGEVEGLPSAIRRGHRRGASPDEEQQAACPERHELRRAADQRAVWAQTVGGGVGQLAAGHVEGSEPRQGQRCVALDARVSVVGRFAANKVPDVPALGPRSVGGSHAATQGGDGICHGGLDRPGTPARAIDSELPELKRWWFRLVRSSAAPDVDASALRIAPDGLTTETRGSCRLFNPAEGHRDVVPGPIDGDREGAVD